MSTADIEEKKIDKSYTLYKKNEEFQRLLDEEYNKLKVAETKPEEFDKEQKAVEEVKAVASAAENSKAYRPIEDETIYMSKEEVEARAKAEAAAKATAEAEKAKEAAAKAAAETEAKAAEAAAKTEEKSGEFKAELAGAAAAVLPTPHRRRCRSV